MQQAIVYSDSKCIISVLMVLTNSNPKGFTGAFFFSHLHLKSQDPAASRTLLGCQSRLRTVERMGFLMCLLTHLD